MKFGVVNKSTTVNRYVLHILHRNITHLAIVTRKTNIKLGILKGGTGKEPPNLLNSAKKSSKIDFVNLKNPRVSGESPECSDCPLIHIE